jgi:hypothetical protein
MEKTPLYFDMGVLRKEAVVPQGVAKLVRLIHTRKLNDAEQIMNYGKGAFRADIRRMFRIGLLYEDSGKIYTNSQHRLLERYLDEPEDEPEETKSLFADVGENVIEYPTETTADEITDEEPEPEKDVATEGDDDMFLKRLKEQGWCFLSEADPFLDDAFQKTEDHAFLVSSPEEALEKLKNEGRELSLVETLNRAYTAFKQPLRGELFDIDWKAPVAFVPTVVGGKSRWVVFFAPPHTDLTLLLSKGRDAVRKNQPFFLEETKETVTADDG